MIAPALKFPRLIGHRGAARLAPENTLIGFRKAASLGVTWVEFDVQLSMDNVPVLMHDATLERTTSGTGRVRARDYETLAELDAGLWFGLEFAGERVPRLDQALDLLVRLDLSANVELKPLKGDEKVTAAAVAATLALHWPKHRPLIVSSFNHRALRAMRAVAPEWPRGFLVRKLDRTWRKQAEAIGCASIHCAHLYLTEAKARAVKRAGYPLAVYTVNDAPVARRLFGWGVDGVFTDDPQAMAKSLKYKQKP